LKKQDNKELIIDIQKQGCLFLSLGRIVELVLECEFTVEQINRVWELCIENKVLDTKDGIKNPDKVLMYFCHSAGRYIPIHNVGSLNKDGSILYIPWVKKELRKASKYPYLIHERGTKGYYHQHFVLCNSDKEVIFDSYDFKDYDFSEKDRYDVYGVYK